ncbi:MAG: hypothetical protein AABX32_02810 [Nanoarchaeota archaeon]
MFARPVYALLISGNESPHYQATERMAKFVRDRVGIPQQRIKVVPASGREGSLADIKSFFDNLPKFRSLDVVVIYQGHGLPDYFFPNGQIYAYEDFAKLFRGGDRFLFINAACYSGSCVTPFERAGLIPNHGQIITASRQVEKAYGDILINSLTPSLIKGKPYQRKVIGRWVETDVIEFNPKVEIARREMRDGREIEIINDGRWIMAPNPKRTKKELTGKSHPVIAGMSLEDLLFVNPGVNVV